MIETASPDLNGLYPPSFTSLWLVGFDKSPLFPGDRNPKREGGQTARVPCCKNSIIKIGGLVLPLLLEREGERLLG